MVKKIPFNKLSQYMFCFQFTLNFPSPFLTALLTFFFFFFYIVLWMPACLYLLEIFFWNKLHWPTLYDRELAYLLVDALMWTLNSTFYVDPCTWYSHQDPEFP